MAVIKQPFSIFLKAPALLIKQVYNMKTSHVTNFISLNLLEFSNNMKIYNVTNFISLMLLEFSDQQPSRIG